VKEENNCENDCDLSAENLKEVVRRYKELFKKERDLIFRRIRKHS